MQMPIKYIKKKINPKMSNRIKVIEFVKSS